MPVWPLFLLVLQSPLSASAPLTDKEQLQYEVLSSPVARLDFLGSVIERYLREFRDDSQRKNFDGFPPLLNSYSKLLNFVQADFLRVPEEQRRKSKTLRRLEIRLRKAREDLEDFKRGSPADQQAAFDECVEQTESLRTTILQSLFGKGLLKNR